MAKKVRGNVSLYEGVKRANLVAIDPGGGHVGVALFQSTASGWQAVSVGEMEPDQVVLFLQEWLEAGKFDHLVYERFILSPQSAPKLAGSELETVQLIGVIRHLVAWWGGPRWPDAQTTIAGQTNKIKKPAAAWMKANGVRSLAVSSKAGGHAKDAELHGVYYIVHTLGDTLIPTT